MKKINNNQKVFSSDNVMSLLESMSDGIELISEQHGEIVERLDGFEGRFDKLEGKVDKLEGRFDKLEGKVDKLEGRFDKLEGKVDKLQDDVTEIKHKLSQKVDLEDFQKLEKRFLKLEKLVLSSR